MPTFALRFAVKSAIHFRRNPVLLQDLRPLGSVVEATLVSVAFSHIYGLVKNTLSTYWPFPRCKSFRRLHNRDHTSSSRCELPAMRGNKKLLPSRPSPAAR